MQTELGEFLREERLKKGMSLREFSKQLSISHTYLAKLEAGMDARTGKPIEPTVESLDKIAAGLNMNRQEIFAMTQKNISVQKEKAEETEEGERELSSYVHKFIYGLKNKKLRHNGKAFSAEAAEKLGKEILEIFSFIDDKL